MHRGSDLEYQEGKDHRQQYDYGLPSQEVRPGTDAHAGAPFAKTKGRAAFAAARPTESLREFGQTIGNRSR